MRRVLSVDAHWWNTWRQTDQTRQTILFMVHVFAHLCTVAIFSNAKPHLLLCFCTLPCWWDKLAPEAELNCVSGCSFLKQTARVRWRVNLAATKRWHLQVHAPNKDSWQKETPFKWGDDSSLWGNQALHEILEVCNWKITTVLTLRENSNWQSVVWQHFIMQIKETFQCCL